MIIKITVEAIADPISAGIHTSPPSRIIPAIIEIGRASCRERVCLYV
jgi:hypothetical protein